MMVPSLPTGCWLEKAFEYVRVRSKMPDTALFWMLMGYAGAALQDRLYVDWAGKSIYPNLPLLIVAPSGFGKTFALNLIGRLFEHELPYKIAEDSTAESMAKTLARYGSSYFRNSVGYWAVPELSDVFGKKDYQAGLIARVTRLLDNPRDRTTSRATGDAEIKIPGICVLSWLACSTFKWIQEHVDDAISAGGFLPRVFTVYIDKQRPKYVPNPVPDYETEQALNRALHEILTASELGGRQPKTIDLTQYPEWEPISKQTYDDTMSSAFLARNPFVERRLENILRIFIILEAFTATKLAVCETQGTAKFFRVTDIGASENADFANFARNFALALSLAKSIESDGIRLMSDLGFAISHVFQQGERILESAKSHSPSPLSFAQISRNLRLSARELKLILQDLQDRDLIKWNGRTGEQGIITLP